MMKMANFEFKEVKDSEAWDSFLLNTPSTPEGIPRVTFVQSYTWSNLQEEIGTEVLRLGIYSEDKLIGLGLGKIIRAKRGSYLHFRHGPFIDFTNKKLINALVQYLKYFAKKQGLWFIRLSPMIETNSIEEQNLKAIKGVREIPINEVEGMDAWIMQLNYDSEEDLFNSIKKKTRYEIRKAMKSCEVLITKDSKYVEDFYEIEMDTVRRNNNWNAFSKKFTQQEFDHFSRTGDADIILIKYENKFIAGGIFIHYANQTFYHYGASLTEFRNIPAGYLTLWEAIKLAYHRGHSVFNFWGIAPEGSSSKHPWYGLTAFKRKFPGKEQIWMHAIDIPISIKYFLTNLYERYERNRKGF